MQKRLSPATSDASGGAKYKVVPLSHKKNPFLASVDVKVTGTVTYKIQYTSDEARNVTDSTTLTWSDHPDTATAIGTSGKFNFDYPVSAIRIAQLTGSGSIDATVSQAG